ncbi:LysM peptidoglycan-binding domain-containing protein [Maritimibacter fusiformis]|uniref:Peptidoglycan DD-metalloendopeptidase family protein n=1 Tax=Maritimibacter fusiformis TaxID=2603819 RepID=A0A5D0RR80_9RHOB|nr:LysM peptidoglycan-binding domain-containing protein [Maritimibacter fusiformis]TYB83456.1 peptidoglycan DD-metalloendopeptidase family protein [Maritimibacter fusiformis]
MGFPNGQFPRAAVAVAALVALAGCADNGYDFDLRGMAGGFSTTEAALNARTAERPQPDARGVISYPTYQVAVAQRGDTLASVANRVGLPVNEVARYNGIPAETTLRAGEIIALPRRVDGMSAAPTAAGTIDVTTLAGDALDRVGTTPTAPAAAQPGAEPVRHQVQRGETAYSIARRYGVSVRSLADWNSLDSALTVREGQYLLIPVVLERMASAVDGSPPGVGSATPIPPSAAAPLPDETAAPLSPDTGPTSPDLGESRTAASSARMAMPVDGKIVRAFEKGKTDGIDISATAGSAVRAAADGTIAAITRDTDQVPILVIKHSGNILTVYAGIDSIKVKKGDRVTRGQAIAQVRAADPAFLHFQVREGTVSVDPLDYLN